MTVTSFSSVILHAFSGAVSRMFTVTVMSQLKWTARDGVLFQVMTLLHRTPQILADPLKSVC